MTEFERLKRLSNPNVSSQFEKIMAHSAYKLSQWEAQSKAWENAACEAANRKRMAEESSIALKAEIIKQNALLLAQVKALEIANAASARQAKSDCLRKWIMFFVALAGVAVAIVM